MSNIFLAGTGYWKASEIVTNEEIVASFNSYVERFNNNNADQINSGAIEALGPSSTEFIEKASGIKTRYLIDKKNCLDINVMRPVLRQENSDNLSTIFLMPVALVNRSIVSPKPSSPFNILSLIQLIFVYFL